MARLDPADNADETADLIESLGDAVGGEYRAIEAHMVGRVAAELAAGDIDDPNTAARLAAEGRAIARAIPTGEIAAGAIAIAGSAGANAAAARTNTTPPSRLIRQNALAIEFRADLDNMRPRIARWMGDAYVTASQLLTIHDQRESVASRFLARGITGKVYRNGAHMPIGSYAEMVTRTVSNQAAIVGATSSMRQSGLSLCEIIIGSDACESCAANRGKVFSLDGTPAGVYQYPSVLGGPLVTVTVAGPLASASAGKSHFRGPNCRCQIVNYQPGLSSVSASTTWSPEAEAARDRQREIERGIRKWKLEQEAALNDLDRKAAGRKVREWNSRMRDHLNETGRVRLSYREQLGFQSGSILPAPLPRPTRVGP